jgi:hypothetical protein
MFETLLILGVACVVAAVVGGGLKVTGIEIPLVDSAARQVLLAAVGVAIIAGDVAFVGRDADSPGNDGPGDERPTLTLSRNSGPPGTSLRVGGAGFARGEPVRVEFRALLIGDLEADARGRSAGETVVTPSKWPFDGEYEISASGQESGRRAEAPFSVPAAKVRLTKKQGPPGTGLRVKASGFAVGEEVEILLGAEPIADAEANGEGEVSKRIEIPPDTLGGEQFEGLRQSFTFPIIVEGQTSRRVARKGFRVT